MPIQDLWLAVSYTVTVAARSKAWTVFARFNTEIMLSNPTGSMDIYVR
jgi:hypothetical protein